METRAEMLVRTVGPHLDGVVQRASRRARQEIPVYEAVPELEIRQGIARDVGVVMATLSGERAATDDERQALGIIGDTRARQRLPLESMLRVYRITLDEVFQVVWAASENGDLEMRDALDLTRDIWRSADAAMEMAVASYRHRELVLAAEETERRASLVHALLLSPVGVPDQDAIDAGLDPRGRYRAIRARVIGERPEPLHELLVPGALRDGIAILHGTDVTGFSSERPLAVPRPGVVVGVGPAVALGELSRSFTVATRIVDAAATFGLDGVLEITDVALEAIAGAEDVLGDELVARYLGPVGTDPGAVELTETLRVFLAQDCSTERTAAELGLHANSVRKRLHRVEELAGVSLTDVDTLVRLRLALLCDEARRSDPARTR